MKKPKETVAELREQLDTMRRAFEMNKFTLEEARKENERLKETKRPASMETTPALTPRVKSAIALAAREARKSGCTYTGTEHLLLGMLLQGEGIAARHFIAAGMTYEKVLYALQVGRVS